MSSTEALKETKVLDTEVTEDISVPALGCKEYRLDLRVILDLMNGF